MCSFGDKVSVGLLVFWVATLIVFFVSPESWTSFFGSVLGITTATGLTYAMIDENTAGRPANWLERGLVYVVLVSAMAFFLHGQPPSEDEYVGFAVESYSDSGSYSGEEATYQSPTFESRSAAAVRAFLTCILGLFVGVLLKNFVLRKEKAEQSAD